MENQEMNKPQEERPENRELKSLEKEKLSVLEDYDFAFLQYRNLNTLSFIATLIAFFPVIWFLDSSGLWFLFPMLITPLPFMNALWARKPFSLFCSRIFSAWLAILLVVIFPPVLFLVVALWVSNIYVLLFLVLGYYIWTFRFLWHLFVFSRGTRGKGVSLEQAHCVYEHKKYVKLGDCKCPEHPIYDKLATVLSVFSLLHVLAGAAFVCFVVLCGYVAIVTFFEALFSGTGISPSDLLKMLKMISESTPAS